MKEKVLLGMSGGIDSSTSAIILKEMGYEVIGVTLILHKDYHKNDINDAQKTAEKLEIKHIVVDAKKEFKETIIDYFVNSYLSGKTPNPCPLCNAEIKFSFLAKKADELGISKIATGHYAKVQKMDDQNSYLFKGDDPKKSQEYFLALLPQKFLNRILLPLSNYSKEQVREIARKNGFVKLSEKKDSQEICFVPEANYMEFLSKNTDRLPSGGNITNSSGEVIGKHKGFCRYTIGQRRGIGMGFGKPKYVTEIKAKENEIVIGDKEETFHKQIKITVQQEYNKLKENETYSLKIRYKSPTKNAKIIKMNEKELIVEAINDFDAPSPGQLAVFYNEQDMVIASGEIKEVL